MGVRVSIIRISVGWGSGRAWRGRTIMLWHAHKFGGGIYQSPHKDWGSNPCGRKPTSLRMHGPWPAPRAIQAPTAVPPQRGSLFLWHTAHKATLWTPTLTPRRNAFLHHFWSGVAQYSVYEVTPDKHKVRVQGRGGPTSHLDIPGVWPFQACSLSFLGSGPQSAVHRPNMHS